MPNKYTPGPRRTVHVLVRLTDEEHTRAKVRARELTIATGRKVTVCDVLRENVGAR